MLTVKAEIAEKKLFDFKIRNKKLEFLVGMTDQSSMVFRFAAVVLFAVSLSATEIPRLNLVLQDQFREEHTFAGFEKKATLLISADRHGTRYLQEWVERIWYQLEEEAKLEKVHVVPVADLKGVPNIARGIARSMMPSERDRPVLLDWEGNVAESWPTEKRATNLILFDPSGEWRKTVAVRDFDEKLFQSFMSELLGIVAKGDS